MPSIFQFIEQRSSLENPSTSLSNPSAWLSEIFSNKSDSGINVTERSSLNHSAVWNAVQIYSYTIASLGVDFLELDDDGDKTPRKSLPAWRLLNQSSSTDVTSFTHRQMAMSWALLWGNYLANIKRDGRGAPIALQLLDVSKYTGETKAGEKVIYNIETGKQLNPANTLHVPGMGLNGVWGMSVIGCARNSIGLGLATEKFGNNFFKNGANLSSYIEYPGSFQSADQKRLFAEKFNEKYRGIDKELSGGIAVLDQGMKLHQLGVPPEDAQFLQTRKFTIEDVARWFNIQLHMLKELDRSTNNNIENQSLEFIKISLRPYLIKFEQEWENKLLTEDQKRSGRFQIRHNINALLRGDIDTQTKHISTMIEKGVYSIDDGRGYLGLNKVEGGNRRFVQQQLMPLDRVDEVIEKQGGSDGEA